jgi:hypothetical protein
MTSNTDSSKAQARYDFADISIASVTGLAFALIILFICVAPLTDISARRDFVAFWATGQQLIHHANPYDENAMMRIEHSAGLPVQDGVFYMRNLPYGLPLALPLGLVGVRLGAFLWSLILLACLLLSIRILWRMHGQPGNCLHWIGVSFAPAMLCLMMGQTTLFALLGYVLFLDIHRTRPFLAGIALWLCALKPHLFLPFGVVLLAWVIVSRSYKILAGAAVAMATSCAVVSLIYPAAWTEYVHMMRTVGIEGGHFPCLSVALRFWINPSMVGLSFLPAALGCIWALGYFWHRRNKWDWMQHGSPLLLVSLLTAPYSWVYDDCLAIPALLYGAYRTRSRILLAVIALASLLVEIELLCGVKIFSSHYLWTAPAWLVWYLMACAFDGGQQADLGQPRSQQNGSESRVQ